MTGLYRSGMRNPRTGRPWVPVLAHGGHQLRLAGDVALCGCCYTIYSRWQITEGFLPRCTGSVAQLKGETTR